MMVTFQRKIDTTNIEKNVCNEEIGINIRIEEDHIIDCTSLI